MDAEDGNTRAMVVIPTSYSCRSPSSICLCKVVLRPIEAAMVWGGILCEVGEYDCIIGPLGLMDKASDF